MIICDTDIMVDVLRGHPGAIVWLGDNASETIAIPGLVVMELLQGCRNKAEQNLVYKTLKGFKLIWPSLDACDRVLKLFSSQHLSHGIGIIDALIAEITVEANTPLHTFNQKHYLPHPRLRTIQPYK
jgi:predicted nucleic acid-binding protein